MTTFGAWSLMQDGATLTLAGFLLRLGGVIAVYLLFTLLQRWLMRSPLLRSVGLQLNLLVLALLVLVFLGPVLDQMKSFVRNALMAAAVFSGIVFGLKLVDVFLFEWLAQVRKKPPMPLVVRDLGRWGLILTALVLIIHGFFPGANLNVLAVSSLVVGYIVGNATQDTLGNLFAGLALNAERPFQIGDWVTVGGHSGIIVDTTWRATRLRTKGDDFIIIPNSAIAKESILNFSRPTGNHACYLSIGVSYDTPPNKAREVILGVLRETPGVNLESAPMIYLTSYGDFAVNFSIKFFILDFAKSDPIQSAVMDRLWYAFRRNGISIPFPIQDERSRDALADERALRAAQQEAIHQLLVGVELFKSLSADELRRLVNSTQLQMFAANECLFRQGEPGDSFYVIRHGRVVVSMTRADGQTVIVAHLSNGAFFGEMSLLTGAPRSGTITAETDVEVLCVSKQDFAGLLQADADLAVKLAAVLEKREAERHALLSAASQVSSLPETQSSLTTRIRRFFGLT